MKILTTPWKADFLELVHQSKKSIKITSPFVKNDVCAEMINAKSSSSKIDLITSFKLMSILLYIKKSSSVMMLIQGVLCFCYPF